MCDVCWSQIFIHKKAYARHAKEDVEIINCMGKMDLLFYITFPGLEVTHLDVI